MRILFVYDNMYMLGGVQTWLTRVLPRLQAEGRDVELLTRPYGEPWDRTTDLVDSLLPDVAVHVGERYWFRARRSISRLPAADVLVPCNLSALLTAALLQRHAMPEARIVVGVFHHREYCAKRPFLKRHWDLHLGTGLVKALPLSNFIVSTPGMGLQLGDCLGRDMSAAPVVPIPIDTERFRPSPNRRVTPGKIVSVARLAPLYPHHGHMIRVIRDLRERGHAFTYHAYGDGDERGALEAEVRRLGVEDAVFFHGPVPYSRFREVVSDAFAFIGLGTATIEAAACGVPTLLAISGHPGAMTHGFVQDVPGQELGGYLPGHPQQAVAERLLWLAERSEDEYARVEAGARARAEQFSLTAILPQLVDILEGAAPFSLPVSAMDQALGRLDWLVQATLLNLGVPEWRSERYVRDQPV